MGLLQLVRDVRAYFTAENVTASVVLGEREVGKQTNQGAGRANRVAVVPVGGKYAPPRNPGRNPRPLRTWLATAEVHVWAQDPSHPRDEELQYEAVWALHDWFIRALHSKAHGTYQIENPRWTRAPVDLAFGKELVLDLVIEVPILDVPAPTADDVQPAGQTTVVFEKGADPETLAPLPPTTATGCVMP